MNIHLVLLFFATLFTSVCLQDKASNNHLEFRLLNHHQVSTSAGDKKDLNQNDNRFKNDYSDNDLISDPIEIDWQVLVNIDYELKYYKEFDMEMYNPIFSEAVKALHGKEVIIEGYIIPFEVEEEILTLSLNPFASCFFVEMQVRLR